MGLSTAKVDSLCGFYLGWIGPLALGACLRLKRKVSEVLGDFGSADLLLTNACGTGCGTSYKNQ